MNVKESYALLELDCGATAAETRHAYQRQVKIWHPDRFSTDSLLKREAEERIKAINLAYENIRRHLATTASTTASARPANPPPPPAASLADVLKPAARLLRQYGQQLARRLKPAIHAAKQVMADGAASGPLKEAPRSQDRRHHRSFRQALRNGGSAAVQRSGGRTGGRFSRFPVGRRGPVRNTGKGSGPVGAIDGIHPCQAPRCIRKIDRIAAVD